MPSASPTTKDIETTANEPNRRRELEQVDQTPLLSRLIETLRGAHDRNEGQVTEVLNNSARRLLADPSYRRRFQVELVTVMSQYDTTEVLSEVGMLSDESVLAGSVSRIGGKIAPIPDSADNFKQVIDQLIHGDDIEWLELIHQSGLVTWVDALLRSTEGEFEEDADTVSPPEDSELAGAEDWHEHREIASACILLAARITGAGANPRLLQRLPDLDNWESPFIQLNGYVEDFANWLVGHQQRDYDSQVLEDCLAECEQLISSFREDKTKYGTNLELSSLSLRVAQQIHRLQHLIDVAKPTRKQRSEAIAAIVRDVLHARASRHHIGTFLREKLDLLAYLTVGHAARKGDEYVVVEQKEYARFLKRSIGGGALVAAFASLKLALSQPGLAPLPQAFLYGFNYAVCFALIYLLGATLATKQPAMTASRLASSLEGKADVVKFPKLVQAIFRSQFISFAGNVFGAAVFAALLAFAYNVTMKQAMISPEKAHKLLASLHPTQSLTIYYAAIAGVMLSLSGFIAGYVDNFVVFHRLSKRIEEGRGVFGKLPNRMRDAMSKRVDKKTGALTGNIVLGFMLGSAGSIGIILGLPFDIRHIAFSSSHATIALYADPSQFNWGILAIAIASIFVIGLMNFLVSFGLTLAVAIESRKVKGVHWRSQWRALRKLIVSDPLYFFLPLPPRKSTLDDEISND